MKVKKSSGSIGMAMNLCFDEDINSVLSPEQVIFTQFCINDLLYNEPSVDGYFNKFIDSIAFAKLFEYYADEIPYGIAKARTGEPDVWILYKLAER